MIALFLFLMQAPQPGTWTAAPNQPTVGDTIRLERAVSAAPGWRVRVGKLASGSVAEPLGDGLVLATPTPGQWIIRYNVVAWTPGSITLDMPPYWLLGPNGNADSLPGGTAALRVAGVIPDSMKTPGPQPALGPLRLDRASLIPMIAAVAVAAGIFLALLAWRRRGPRDVPEADAIAIESEVADDRWLTAGEPKAVAARAAHRLRSALAHSIPQAHEALSTAECLATVERVRPDAPLRDLRELLEALDQVAFASAHGLDVAPLAARARALAREFQKNGAGTR